MSAEIVERYWTAANARDWVAFGALCAADVVYEVPQTRERVRGREAYVDFNASWPGDWRAEIEHLVAQGGKAVSVIRFISGEKVETGISCFEFEGGLIVRITDWWPEPYEPPPRAAAHIERY